MDIKKIFNKKAFTLAEITIAVAIIGLIATLTLPSMLTSIQNRQYKSGVKKAHTVVSESFDSMKIDENAIYSVYSNENVSATAFRNTYAKYFGFVNRQGQVVADVLKKPEDFNAKYYPLNDTSKTVNESLYNGGGFLARNGMLVMIGKVPKPYDTSSSAIIISIDVDGPKKGDNQLGRDVFCFEVMPSDNVLPVGAKSTKENTTSFDYKTYCKTDTSGDNDLNGIACTYSAINTAEYMDSFGDRAGSAAMKCDGVWNKATQTCMCNHGMVEDSDHSCKCPDGYIKLGKNHCQRDNNPNCILNSSGGDDCCRDEDCDNQKYNEEKSQWECKGGKKLVDGVCTGCANGTEPLTDGVTCCDIDKRSPDGNSCICSEGKEWVDAKKACADKCPNNMTRNNGTGECGCPDGQEAISGGSICCPSINAAGLSLKNSDSSVECSYDCVQGTYNTRTKECECGSGATWADKKCTCTKAHTTWSATGGGECLCENGREDKGNGVCSCKNGSVAEDCGCVAAKGFIASSSSDPNRQCECDTTKGFKRQYGGSECTCANSLRTNKDGVCVCNDELHRININGVCECDTANHWVVNGNQCTCDFANGFEIVENECTCVGNITDGKCERTCKNGATLNKTTKVCECNIGMYSKLNTQKDGCECEGGLHIIQSSSGSYSCGCSSGQIQNGSSCSASGGNSCAGDGKYLDEASQKCVCADGLIEDPNQQNCKCPLGWIVDSAKGTVSVKLGKSSYTRIFCMPDPTVLESPCQCTSCVWTSVGGANGYCNCGEGLYYNSSSKLCSCYGVDVERQDTLKEETVEVDGVSTTKKSTSYSCKCAGKLSYQQSDSSYGCAPLNENGYYEIENAQELTESAPLTGKYKFKLKNNVTVSGNWAPWGTVSNPFKGDFDGQGNTITIDNITSEDDFVGVFGYTASGCKISNLKIKINGNITGKNNVGALVGYNNCRIENVTITGSDGSVVSGESNVGGFVGYNAGEILLSSTDNFTTIGDYVFGGFAGTNAYNIKQSFAGSRSTVGISGRGSYAGGFVGRMTEVTSSIKNSYTQVQNIYANANAAGFVADFEKGSISYVYSTVDIDNIIADGKDYFVAQYNTPGRYISLLNSFFLDKAHNKTYEDIDSLYGKTADELKNPAIYLCAYWNQEPCIWAYDVSKTTTPKLVQKNESCDTTCSYSNSVYTVNGTCSEYDTHVLNQDNCENLLQTCEEGQHLDSSNVCVSCTGGQEWDDNDKVCKCLDDQEWNSALNQCVCKNASTSIYVEDLGCINCASAGASKVGDECVCASGTFDMDMQACVTSECEKYDGIVEDETSGTCIMPSPLNWTPNATDKTKGTLTCVDSANITIETNSDLLYVSRCSYDGDIEGGSQNWTLGKNFTLDPLDGRINMEDFSSGRHEFKPIQNFGGDFNGNNKNIANLTINSTENNVGLFSTLNENAKIYNLYLNAFAIKGNNNVGVLAGSALLQNNTVQKVFVNNSVLEANENAGGLIGMLTPSGDVELAFIAAITNIKAANIQGGLFGYVEQGGSLTLNNAYALSFMETLHNAGGLIGFLASSATLAGVKNYYYSDGISKAIGQTLGTSTLGSTIFENTCPADLTGYDCVEANSYPYFSEMMTSIDTDSYQIDTFIKK